jgi:hypothetical protein
MISLKKSLALFGTRVERQQRAGMPFGDFFVHNCHLHLFRQRQKTQAIRNKFAAAPYFGGCFGVRYTKFVDQLLKRLCAVNCV